MVEEHELQKRRADGGQSSGNDSADAVLGSRAEVRVCDGPRPTLTGRLDRCTNRILEVTAEEHVKIPLRN